MKNTFGSRVTVTLFGESHGPSVGVVVDGLPAGMVVDTDCIESMLNRRRPVGAISTARREADAFVIESGVFEGRTTGTPVCIRIPNEDTRSEDYGATRWLARPSHADYTANQKYHSFEDYRGGGHFSGRLTAALVAAGALVMPALHSKGIRVGTHIKSIGGIEDRGFGDLAEDLNLLDSLDFAALDHAVGERMMETITQARQDGDSVGGVLETAVIGLKAGLGEPWFDTVESMLAHGLFAIPAIKGVEFGDGFGLAALRGSQANDPFTMRDGKVCTTSNHSGGINGGITNGMPLLFRCVVRPTPTISKEQQTVNMQTGENTTLQAKGRHDPCIVHRARVVVDAMTALTVCDLLSERYGTDWLGDV